MVGLLKVTFAFVFKYFLSLMELAGGEEMSLKLVDHLSFGAQYFTQLGATALVSIFTSK